MINVLEKKHAILVTEFDRYIVEHPEVAARIPQNAQIVLQIEGDEEYNAWSRELADWQTYEDYPSWRHARKLRIFPEDDLLVAAHNADSTKEEAQYLRTYIRQHGFKRVIIVTSNYHTWRTKRVYDKEWKDGDVLFYIL